MAGDEDHRGTHPAPAQLLVQFAAGHAGHADVEQQAAAALEVRLLEECARFIVDRRVPLARLITGRFPLGTNSSPLKISIQGGAWLSESITTFRWWWIQTSATAISRKP